MLSIDFLPEKIRIQRARRKNLARLAYLLCACGFGMVAIACVGHSRKASARDQRTMLDKCSENTRQQLALRETLELEEAKLNIKKEIDEELGSRVNTRDIFAELSRLLPKSMSITKFSLEATEVPVKVQRAIDTEASNRPRPAEPAKEKVKMVKRVTVAIEGLAPNDVDVANFIGQLSACPLFENVDMGYTKTVQFRGREAREFQARCHLIR